VGSLWIVHKGPLGPVARYKVQSMTTVAARTSQLLLGEFHRPIELPHARDLVGVENGSRLVILLSRAVRVYFAMQPTNLRQSCEELSNQIRYALGGGDSGKWNDWSRDVQGSRAAARA
jgi:hypothetical protein